MMYFSQKLLITLTVTTLLLGKGVVGSGRQIITSIQTSLNSAEEVKKAEEATRSTTVPEINYDDIESENDTTEGNNKSIGTDSETVMVVPTPEPTPTPTPTPKTSTQSGGRSSFSPSHSGNNGSNSGTSNPVPATNSGTKLFAFSSYEDDADATFNACVAEANNHASASCDVAGDDSGYILTYSG